VPAPTPPPSSPSWPMPSSRRSAPPTASSASPRLSSMTDQSWRQPSPRATPFAETLVPIPTPLVCRTERCKSISATITFFFFSCLVLPLSRPFRWDPGDSPVTTCRAECPRRTCDALRVTCIGAEHRHGVCTLQGDPQCVRNQIYRPPS
jgi:hypothetical protein